MSAVPDRIFLQSITSRDHPGLLTANITGYQNNAPLNRHWNAYVYTMAATDAQIGKESEIVRKEMHERDTAVNQRVDAADSNQASLKRRVDELYQQHSERIDQETRRLDQDVKQAKTEIIKKINTVLVDEIKQETQQEVHELKAALQAAKQEAEELRQELNQVKTAANRAEELANKLSEEMQKMRSSISSMRS